MAVSIFSGSNPAIIYGGRFGAPFSNSGTLLIQTVGLRSEYRFDVTGTQLRLGVYKQTSPVFSYSVDGGAFADLTPSGGGGVEWLTIFTGLSDTIHTVVIRAGGYTDYTNMVEVTGASPAISQPSGYTAQYILKTQSGISLDNTKDIYGSTSVEGYNALLTRGSYRFKATTDTVRVWCRHDAVGDIALCVDGDADNLLRVATAGTYGWVSFTGLDGTAEHTYRIVCREALYCYSLNLSGTLNTTALTAWPADYWQGDSITAGSNVSGGDIVNFPVRFGLLTNRGWQIQGTAGGTAVTHGQAQKASPGASSPPPQNVFLLWGFNDHRADATWESAITAILTKIAADLPSAKIRWCGVFPSAAANSYAAPTLSQMNSSLSATVAAFADPDVTFVDTSSLSVVATSDGTHPTAAGAAAIGDYLAGLFADAAPSTGKRMDNRFMSPR